MPDLLPLFVNLNGRAVVLVGGGRVAAGKLQQLLTAGARVRLISPEISEEVGTVVERASARRPINNTAPPVDIAPRAFVPEDLDGAWLAVAAATPEVNRAVAQAAETRRVFVNAVDDPPNASAFLSGVVRRDGVTLAISTSGDAPALTALLREAIDAVLPSDLDAWMKLARAERIVWRREGVPMEQRKPLLLRALNDLYRSPALVPSTAEGRQAQDIPSLSRDEGLRHAQGDPNVAQRFPPPLAFDSGELRRGSTERETREGGSPAVPWLNGPEDSWL